MTRSIKFPAVMGALYPSRTSIMCVPFSCSLLSFSLSVTSSTARPLSAGILLYSAGIWNGNSVTRLSSTTLTYVSSFVCVGCTAYLSLASMIAGKSLSSPFWSSSSASLPCCALSGAKPLESASLDLRRLSFAFFTLASTPLKRTPGTLRSWSIASRLRCTSLISLAPGFLSMGSAFRRSVFAFLMGSPGCSVAIAGGVTTAGDVIAMSADIATADALAMAFCFGSVVVHADRNKSILSSSTTSSDDIFVTTCGSHR
mmetsp:Transcript_10118/g.27134  ORF Transcript_10118/g.27134 Transcript_10118/m.27134 type:complete len:257 (-) Transcript_10118:156-926(-)